MALDGHLLALAREKLAARRAANESELARRRQEVYERVPRLRELEGEHQRLCAEIVSVMLKDRSDPQAALTEIDEKSAALLQEKGELLTAAGYPADYLEEIVSCPKCRDKGQDRQGRPCECLLQLYAREQAAELSSRLMADKDDFAAFDLNYYSAETDPRWGISPRACMEMTLSACRQYAEHFGPASPNLLFRGGTGLGKTFLSACIAKQVAAAGHSVVYETAVAVFEAFERQKFSRDADEEAAAKIRRILSCELLILDDLGTEMNTAFTQSALYTIVNSRLMSGGKTIISTNLSAEEMAARYTPQTVSRIGGEYDTLLFLGRDIRAQKKEQRYR